MICTFITLQVWIFFFLEKTFQFHHWIPAIFTRCCLVQWILVYLMEDEEKEATWKQRKTVIHGIEFRTHASNSGNVNYFLTWTVFFIAKLYTWRSLCMKFDARVCCAHTQQKKKQKCSRNRQGKLKIIGISVNFVALMCISFLYAWKTVHPRVPA